VAPTASVRTGVAQEPKAGLREVRYALRPRTPRRPLAAEGMGSAREADVSPLGASGVGKKRTKEREGETGRQKQKSKRRMIGSVSAGTINVEEMVTPSPVNRAGVTSRRR
jgi:hypothetical protein